MQIKRGMDKGEHYMMWKSKGGCKKRHYDVQIKRAEG